MSPSQAPRLRHLSIAGLALALSAAFVAPAFSQTAEPRSGFVRVESLLQARGWTLTHAPASKETHFYWDGSPAARIQGAWFIINANASQSIAREQYRRAARAMDFVLLSARFDGGALVRTDGGFYSKPALYRDMQETLMDHVASVTGKAEAAAVPLAFTGESGNTKHVIEHYAYHLTRAMFMGCFSMSQYVEDYGPGLKWGFFTASEGRNNLSEGNWHATFDDESHSSWTNGFRGVFSPGWGSGHDMDRGQKYEYATYLMWRMFLRRMELAGPNPARDSAGAIILPDIPLESGWLGEAAVVPTRPTTSPYLPIGPWDAYTGYKSPGYPTSHTQGYEPAWLPDKASAIAYRASHSMVRKENLYFSESRYPAVGDDYMNGPLYFMDLEEFEGYRQGDLVTCTVHSRDFGNATGGIKEVTIYLDGEPVQTLTARNSGQNWRFSFRVFAKGVSGLVVEAEDMQGNRSGAFRAIAVERGVAGVARNDTFLVRSGTTTSLSLTGNDSGSGLIVRSISTPGLGSAVLNADNTVSFTAPAGTGETSFTYLLRDWAGAETTATATIQVLADAPNLEAGLQLHYRLDETSGNGAPDTSGLTPILSGTLNNAPTWRPIDGKVAGALKFNGSNQSVSVPANARLDGHGAMTIAAWVHPDARDGTQRGLISKRDSNTVHGYSIDIVNGQVGVQVDGTDTPVVRILSANALPTGQWSHVAVTIDGAAPQLQRLKIYVNGVLRRTGEEVTAGVPTTAATLRIGTLTANGGRFNGMVDDVRIYNRVLTADELTLLNTLPRRMDLRSSGTPVANAATETIALSGANAPVTRTYSVLNAGTEPLALTGTTFGNPINCAPQITTALPASVTGGVTVPLTFTVTPIAPGPWSVVVEQASDDPETPTLTWYVEGTARSNATPVAGDDYAEADAAPITLDVLANDRDGDPGDSLTLTAVSTAARGTASIIDNKVRYTPNPFAAGADAFTYTVRDSVGATATATVRVTVVGRGTVLEESFDYQSMGESIAGRNGGRGFTAAWHASAGNLAAGLNYPGWDARGAAITPLTYSDVVGRTFSTNGIDVNGRTTWFSLLVRGIKDIRPAEQGLFFSQDMGVILRPSGSTHYLITAPGSSASPSIPLGQTALVIGRVVWADGNDDFRLWVNPPGWSSVSALGSPTATRDFTGVQLPNAVTARGRYSDLSTPLPGDVIFDELRLGPTLASVTPRRVGANWREAHFPTADLDDPAREAAVWGNSADPDGDGLPNLVEYAMGASPHAPHRLEAEFDGNRVGMTFTRQKSRPDVRLIFEVSTDLVHWTTEGVTWETLRSNEQQDLIRASLPATSSAAFFRLRAEPVP